MRWLPACKCLKQQGLAILHLVQHHYASACVCCMPNVGDTVGYMPARQLTSSAQGLAQLVSILDFAVSAALGNPTVQLKQA